MKPTKKLAGGVLLVMIFCGLSLALVSWRGDREGQTPQATNDTVPKKHSEPRNLDEVLAELEAIDIRKTLEEAQLQMEEAMKGIDLDKIRIEIENSMKDIDFEKMEIELKESLAKIDFDELKEEMQEAMKEIDFEKMEIELRESLEGIDIEKMKTELQKVREIDMKELEEELAKVKENLKDLGPQLEREMDKAKESIEKAKVEIREYKTFVDGLEKDGLIDKKAGFTLEHKDGELLINGKKAANETYNKYRSFLEKHKQFRLVQNDDEFDLDND